MTNQEDQLDCVDVVMTCAVLLCMAWGAFLSVCGLFVMWSIAAHRIAECLAY